MKKLSIGYGCFFSILLVCSCGSSTESLNPQERSMLKDSVLLMTASVAKDLSREGPIAWLSYFENTPDFYMVSDGQLVFPNIDSANKFIRNVLIKIMPKIELRWNNIQIDPLTNKLASLSAVYHEDITDSTGKTIAHDGYFTAVAHQSSQGWKLRNAHWSSVTH